MESPPRKTRVSNEFRQRGPVLELRIMVELIRDLPWMCGIDMST